MTVNAKHNKPLTGDVGGEAWPGPCTRATLAFGARLIKQLGISTSTGR